MQIFKEILSDINGIKRRNPEAQNISIKDIVYLIFSYTGYAILLVRLLTNSRNKIVKFIIRNSLRKKYLIEIGDNVEIGLSLKLPHPRNIIIVGGTTIGHNVQINQNVTIGGNNKKVVTRGNGCIQKVPNIGNNVMIYANAVVAGPVIIEDHVLIGANCTVTHDIESGSMIYSSIRISGKKINISNQGGSYIEI